jgi:hypothetical protein
MVITILILKHLKQVLILQAIRAAGNVVEGLAGAFATAKQQKRTLQEANK